MLRLRHIVTKHQTKAIRPCSVSTSSTTSSSSDSNSNDSDDKHPIRRTLRLLGNDMRKVKEFFVPKKSLAEDDLKQSLKNSKYKFKGEKDQPSNLQPLEFQTHCDVLVIGGGSIGSSIAYWLKHKAREGLNVVVVEKDDTYASSATCLSVCGLRQQLSLPENIQMSLFGADFLRESGEHFGNDIPINFTPHGHLVLASEQGAEILKQNSQLQNELGARNELLTPARLSARFPWLDTSGIALGCHGLEKEGWFDPWALLTGFRRAACGYGAHYVNGEVVGFEFRQQQDITISGYEGSNEDVYEGLDKVVVKLSDGTQKTIKFALCVIAAGSQSNAVARMARIGCGSGMLTVPLPVLPRKHCVYAIRTNEQDAPGLRAALTIDPNGTYFTRDGLSGNYFCGRNSTENAEHSCNDLKADLAFFESHIRPTLIKRVPSFKSAELVDSWAGFYEYNEYDENGIIGQHPYYNNLFFATGFGALAVQQSPAVGRALSEMIMDGQFRTIDLSRLSFDRLIVDKPMYELNIV